MSEELHLSVNHRELGIPLLQGGVGVGVSLEHLAGSVAACGAMGCISTADCGYREPDFYKNPEEANLRALRQEISDAHDISGGRGLLAINAMVATQQFAEAIRTAVASGIDAVVLGAGLPLQLPELVSEGSALIAPIVSGGRTAKLILQSWMKKYNHLPDFIVVEGAKAEGHLRFKEDELLAGGAPSLAAILKDVLENIRPFVDAAKRSIPVFCTGGVWNREDIQALTEQGTAGVQIATRFIATKECDVSQAYKDVLLGVKRGDVSIIHSPVGMSGCAVQTLLLKRLSLAGRIPLVHCSHCIRKRSPAQVPFCITNALIEAVKGNLETGLFFTGENVGRMKKMTTVSALIRELGY